MANESKDLVPVYLEPKAVEKKTIEERVKDLRRLRSLIELRDINVLNKISKYSGASQKELDNLDEKTLNIIGASNLPRTDIPAWLDITIRREEARMRVSGDQVNIIPGVIVMAENITINEWEAKANKKETIDQESEEVKSNDSK